MRFFFRSRQFKIIIAVFLIVIAVSVTFALIGTRMSPQTDIAGTIAAPFRTLATGASNIISDFIGAYNDGNKLMLENAELSAQLAELREKISDYEEKTAQNNFYKDYLGIKDEHPDFQFMAATCISQDGDDPYGGFIINKGSISDIDKYDPVITDAGLVGYITEIGTTTAKVTTILSPQITLGALDSRTRDSGIVSGGLELSENGLCRLSNLSRSCNVAVGDYVVTSGEGIFPSGILIGTIEYIGSDKYNTSIYADVRPFANISEIREVMVITSFEGQGGISVGS